MRRALVLISLAVVVAGCSGGGSSSVQSKHSTTSEKRSPATRGPTTTSPDLSTEAGQVELLSGLVNEKANAFAAEIHDNFGMTITTFKYVSSDKTVYVVAQSPISLGFGEDNLSFRIASFLAPGIWMEGNQQKVPLALPRFDLTLTDAFSASGASGSPHYACPPEEMVALANGNTDQAAFAKACGSVEALRALGRIVTYEVTGTGSASLTIQNESGGTEQFEVGLPWSRSFNPPLDGFVYVSAQLNGSGDVHCKITQGGRVVQEASSSGEYVIASCSGSVTAI